MYSIEKYTPPQTPLANAFINNLIKFRSEMQIYNHADDKWLLNADAAIEKVWTSSKHGGNIVIRWFERSRVECRSTLTISNWWPLPYRARINNFGRKSYYLVQILNRSIGYHDRENY